MVGLYCACKGRTTKLSEADRCPNRIYVEYTGRGSVYRLFAEREGHTVLLYVTLWQVIKMVLGMIGMRFKLIH